MRVLVACEYSGRVRNAFLTLGHDVVSADFEPSDDNSPYHYQGDVFDLLADQKFDLMIAHPPCTYLCNSGVRWLHEDPTRWAKLDAGAEFFNRLRNAAVPKKCIENPVMHKYAKALVGQNQTQVIQPYMFGHLERKATCLWLTGLPPLQPTNLVYDAMMLLPKRERERLHYCSPGPDRWKIRSRTFLGIAEAMAAQWGGDVREKKSAQK